MYFQLQYFPFRLIVVAKVGSLKCLQSRQTLLVTGPKVTRLDTFTRCNAGNKVTLVFFGDVSITNNNNQIVRVINPSPSPRSA